MSRAIYFPEQNLLIPPSANDLAGFRTWAKSEAFPQRGRISFLDTEIFIDMSPEELATHNLVKTETNRVVGNLNKKRQKGVFLADGALLTNVPANLSTEPDALFVLWRTLESGLVRLIPREGEEGQYMEVEGTPDWVLEVVSKYSVRKDTLQLRASYFRAGIPEYWLIDARGPKINFQVLLRGKTGFVAAPTRGGWQRSEVFGCYFRLIRRRGRMNFWDYTLQTKALR